MDTINNRLIDRNDVASRMWQDREGWRGWVKMEKGFKDKDIYFFNDIPDKSLMSAMDNLITWRGN